MKHKIVIAHLGGGCSLCAVRDGISVETTMGFTPLDGLMMGTRSGSIDPGIILYLVREKGMTAKEIERILYTESGLLGISGISSDMHELLTSDAPAAADAIALFVYRTVKEIAAMTAALEGIDMLVFTGGIGEHAWQIRQMICQSFGWLGLKIDIPANRQGHGNITAAGSAVDVCVIQANEEIAIARHTERLINAPSEKH